MGFLLHLNNIVLFLSLFDYSSQKDSSLEQSTTNVGCIINWDEFPSDEDEFWNRTILTPKTDETRANLTKFNEDIYWNKTILSLETDDTRTNITNLKNPNKDEYWNKNMLSLEADVTKTYMKKLQVQCRNNSYFKIEGGFLYENKTYLESNTFNCVNGTLQDLRERRFSRQNIECHEKLLCGGQNLTVRFI